MASKVAFPLEKPQEGVGAPPRFQDRPLEEIRQKMGLTRRQLVVSLPLAQALPNVGPDWKCPIEKILGLLDPFLGDPAHVQVEAAGGLFCQRVALAGETPRRPTRGS